MYMPYSDFYKIEEIESGAYGTVYTAKYRNYSEVWNMRETVVLKRFKSFDKTLDIFINEVSKYLVLFSKVILIDRHINIIFI